MTRCRNPGQPNPRLRLCIALTAAVLAAGCATPSTPSASKRAGVQVEIQQDIGFTITEPARISGGIREEYQTAMALIGEARPSEGIAILERIVAEAPELSTPVIDLGIAYHLSGDLESAETMLTRALALNADHPVVHNEIGIIYRKTGRFAEARASYEQALSVYPGFHYARRNLAVLCDLYLNDLPCALENYEAYMETVPEDPEASIWIADIRSRLGQ